MKLSQFFRKKATVGVHHSYGLTALGKTKAEEFSLSGPKWEVLAVLNENGPSSVSEIAEESKSSTDKIKAILRMLIRSGYVRRVTDES